MQQLFQTVVAAAANDQEGGEEHDASTSAVVTFSPSTNMSWQAHQTMILTALTVVAWFAPTVTFLHPTNNKPTSAAAMY
jgi:hypothetical protein